MTNQICNLIAKIKNGQLARKAFVLQVKQKSCENVLNVLWNEGFILGYKKLNSKPNTLKIFLKYKNNVPVINSIKMLSKPSLRIYYSVKQLWKLDPNKGLIIISTNRGLMSISDCKKKILGGEPMIIIK